MVYVEKAEDGSYWGSTQNIPGVVSTYGNSLEELKNNLEQAFSDYSEVAEDLKEAWVQDIRSFRGFEYQMEIRSI